MQTGGGADVISKTSLNLLFTGRISALTCLLHVLAVLAHLRELQASGKDTGHWSSEGQTCRAAEEPAAGLKGERLLRA